MADTTLNSIDKDKWGFLLCFPYPNEDCVRIRTEKLVDVGVLTLLSEGKENMRGLRVLGKGHASVVIKAILKPSLTVAIKVRRTDSKRDSLKLECEVMKAAYPVAPRVYHCEDDFIIMEYVDGVPIGEVMDKVIMEGCDEALPMVFKVLGAARYLDLMGVEHKELSLLREHVLITGNGRVKVIDYESASPSEAPCNVCRVCSWFIYRSAFGRVCCRNLERLETELRKVLRKYKARATNEAFKTVINVIARFCPANSPEL